MADAAGCSSKPASDSGNGPWHAIGIFTRGAAATAGPDGAARRSNPFRYDLLMCTRHPEIQTVRGAPSGLRGGYCCIARRFRGYMGLGKLLRTVQGDELQRLLALLLQHSIISPFLCLICQLNSPNNTADAAGCSPKAAFGAGNVPRHTVYSRARGAGAGPGRAGAARRSNPCVMICSCAHGARS